MSVKYPEHFDVDEVILVFLEYQKVVAQRDELLKACKQMTEKPLHKVDWFGINQLIARIESSIRK